MTPKISLKQLRANQETLKQGGRVIEDWCAEPDEVLALIDTAEAANELSAMINLPEPKQDGITDDTLAIQSRYSLSRLRETLDKFDQ